jgi:hypothetical protein
MILGVIYFWLYRVSLAEYLLILRALFPLVADGQIYYGTVSTVSSRLMLFVGDDPELALYFELCVSVCGLN